MPVLTATERLGTVIDEKYAVERVLAQGGMGVVFEATHTWTGRRVALKLIKPDMVEPSRDARLRLEARTATALSHPNVVQVLDMGATEDGVSYLVMELLEGRTLKDELLARGKLPPAETLELVLPLLGAIAVAHGRGIVHRDLKPANILLSLDSAGRRVPKLLDFGIAKPIEETGMTRSGTVLGTPHYLSPEQAEGDGEVGPAADIWALGVILYECLSGKLPFPGDHAAGVLQRVLNQPAPPLCTQAPELEVALATAVERALHREPRLRYAGARDFALALLVTASDCGIDLPESPDPTGLPDWSAWLRDAADGTNATMDDDGARAAELSATTPEEKAVDAPRSRSTWALVLIVLSALLVYLLAHHQAPPASTKVAQLSSTEASLAQRPSPQSERRPPARDPAPATPLLPAAPSVPADANSVAAPASEAPLAISPPAAKRALSRRRVHRETVLETVSVPAPPPAPATQPSSREKLMRAW